MRGLSPADAAHLDTRLGAPDLDAGQIAELRDLITLSGAPSTVEDRIEALLAEALAALAAAPVADGPTREVLRALADAATVRKY